MFRKCLMVVRDVEDARILLKILQRLKFEGFIILTTLDVAYIPISDRVVSLNHPEWINDCLSILQEYTTDIKIKIIKYSGNMTPAEALINLIKDEECDFVLVSRRNIILGAGADLTLSLAGLSPVPVMVIPHGSV